MSVDEFDLEAALRKPSSTPDDQRSRCPECKVVKIKNKTQKGIRPRTEGDYWCTMCDNHFDEPYVGEI